MYILGQENREIYQFIAKLIFPSESNNFQKCQLLKRKRNQAETTIVRPKCKKGIVQQIRLT